MIRLVWLLSGCDADPALVRTVPHETDPASEVPVTTPPVPPPTDPTAPYVAPTPCDAGDEAWVQRVMPLVWGRRAHGAAEVRMWATMALENGRDTVVRAMMHSPEAATWWRTWFTDALYVARTGDKAYDECFASPLLESHDGALAMWIRDNDPHAGGFDASFNMADVIADSLVLDDLSIPYKAHLFARMNRPVQGANVPEDEMEYNRRVNFGELFFSTYLGRNTTCIGCHNSAWSTTDDLDPALDRTWQIPGLFERALLGADEGGNVDEHYAMFRYDPLVDEFGGGGTTVWGMHEDCGRFNGPLTFGPDVLGQETSYFIESYDGTGSVWDLVVQLDAGVDLVDDGLYVQGDRTVDGTEGFAYLLGAHVADLVWKQAMGEALTIAHGFPRNEPQVDRLQSLADAFVESRFSLVTLLVAVADDPQFNVDGPDTCATDLYGLDALVNPWSVFESDPVLQGNSAGDHAHRQTARVLLQSAYDQLGWGNPPDWNPSDDDEALLAAIGAFLREAEPGFNGSDFQGVLAFEERFGACANPTQRADAIDQLVEAGLAADATVGDLVAALKDRLLANAALDPEEAAFVEDLLTVPLDTSVAVIDDLVHVRLRNLCGALLLSPDWQLALDPGSTAEPPILAADPTRDCWDLMLWMAEEDVTVDCERFEFVP